MQSKGYLTGSDNVSAPGIIICEEMAFMEDTLWDVVFPLTGRDKATLIGITTMDSYFNPVNQLFEMKNEKGEPLMNVLVFDFVCDECKELGLEMSCTHRLHELPPHLSGHQYQKMEQMYKAGGKDQNFLAEMKGVMKDESLEPMFPKKIIDRFERKPMVTPFDLPSSPNIFVLCDPYGQGPGSEYAIVSMINYGRRRIIVGLESFSHRKPLKEYDIMIEHMLMLRQIPALERARIWVIPETNMSGHAAWHETKIKENRDILPDVHLMYEATCKGRPSPGFHTHQGIKLKMAHICKAALENDRIELYRAFVTVGGKPREDVRKILFTQMRNLCMKKYPTINPEDDPKITITGKLRHGMCDDVMTMLMAALWIISVFYQKKDEYGAYH